MRSRLEARFAASADDQGDCRWDYEPRAFADESGQYLPDFVINREGSPTCVVELKGAPQDPAPLFKRMEIVWSSEPDHLLCLWIDGPPQETWWGWHGRWRNATEMAAYLPIWHARWDG